VFARALRYEDRWSVTDGSMDRERTPRAARAARADGDVAASARSGSGQWWNCAGDPSGRTRRTLADLFGVARSTVYRAVERERTRNVMGVGTTVG